MNTRTTKIALAPVALMLAGLVGCSTPPSAPVKVDPAPSSAPATSIAVTPSATATSESKSSVPSAVPTSTPTTASSQTATITPPSFGEEEWRTKAKTVKEMGASGFITYSNNADGAVIAFEDLFKSMAFDFSTTYHGDEDDVSTEAEKNKLVDQQLPRTMKYLDREALGTKKVNAFFSEWALPSRALAEKNAAVRASRDGVTQAADGTVTISDGNMFFEDPSNGELNPISTDGGHYKFAYKYNTWVLVDYNLDGPIE